ncbi:MAG: hypothetical protein WBH24_12260 [Candidatus Acidiferrum sp.]|jgi:hypothetical protein
MIPSLNPHLLWPQLPTLTRLYSVVLCVGSLYILYSLLRIAIRLQSLRQLAAEDSTNKTMGQAFSTLHARLDNVRQVIILLWLVFGFSLFVELALLQYTADHSRMSLVEIMLRGLTAQSGYGSMVFLVFLVLHVAQWAVSSRLASLATQRQLG